MQIQNNKKIFKIIQTTKGDILSPIGNNLNTIKLTIFNQILSPKPLQRKINSNLDLQHIKTHLSNPFSLQNTSITWGSIQHELRQIINQTNLNISQILLFDSSDYLQKIPEIFNQFQIIKGYNYRLKELNLRDNIKMSQISEQKKSLLMFEHVLKQIQFQFNLGNGGYKPGYIGEIMFEELSNQLFAGVMKAYFQFSKKYGCPIVLNFNQKMSQCYFYGFKNDKLKQRYSQKIKILTNFLHSYKTQKQNVLKNIVIYNMPIYLELNAENFSYKNVFQDQIQKLIQEYGVNLGFSLLRYSKKYEKEGINQIIKITKKHTTKIIISSGLTFKTDFTNFGGQGMSLYSQFNKLSTKQQHLSNINSIQYLKNILNENIIDQIMRSNILKLMDWKDKRQEIKIQIFWKCDQCQKDFSQKIKAFGKFGKQFCSINCLKTFKF